MKGRVKSGITGLDDILGGGFFQGQTYGITGNAGSGKSILSMEFLVKGAMMGEKGLYITSEVSPEKLVAQMPFKNLPALIKDNQITIYNTRPEPDQNFPGIEKFDLPGLTYMVKHYVKNREIKRVVFDSISAFTQQYDSKLPLRRELNNLITVLESFGCTTLLVFELEGVQCGAAEYMVDGVIELGSIETQHDVTRYAQVKKIRGTRHDLNKRAIEIQDSGITISNMKPF